MLLGKPAWGSVAVFAAYGTADICVLECDLLPLCFGLVGKKDYRMMPMVGWGYKFENINPGSGRDWNDTV